MKTIKDIDVKNIRVLVKTDFNVPVVNGRIIDNTKIKETLPTINYLRDRGARIILMSEFGRPKGHITPEYRVNPIADELEKLLKVHVKKIDETVGKKTQKAVSDLNPGEILILENLSFNQGELKNDESFSMELASLADIYVDDAFSSSHKEIASNVGVTKFKLSYAGFFMEKELSKLNEIMQNIKHPLTLILGNGNPEIKLNIVRRFLSMCETILLAGEISLAFIKAQGFQTGKTYIPDEVVKIADEILTEASSNNVVIKLPEDFLVAKEEKQGTIHRFVNSKEIPDNYYVVDIGPKTFWEFNNTIYDSNMILWSGVMGKYKIPDFSYGTRSITQAVASSSAKTIAGGEDTIEAINAYDKSEYIDIISLGGDAFLKYLEGQELPAINVLKNSKK